MDWVKLRTDYYLDAAVLRAGEAAEVLFTRGLAYVGGQESDGFIPAQALPVLAPTRGPARAAALVREGLWDVVDGGWVIPRWVKHQVTGEQLEQKREAGRTRVARHRARRNGVTNAVGNGESRSTEVEVEEEVEDAAAAASSPPPLPPSLEILKARLDAAKMTVRWDRLTPGQMMQIDVLIDTHGDAALVRAAVQMYRPDRPAAFVQAWLEGWLAMPAPGQLRLVGDPCKEPGHTGTTRHCAACASERLAGDA